MTIIEHKGKQYNLINPLRFDEVDAIFSHTRKYIELTERLKETKDQVEYETLCAQHIRALDDQRKDSLSNAVYRSLMPRSTKWPMEKPNTSLTRL